MQRLLSPNEAKFWLLDAVAPMNSIVVVERRRGDGPPPRVMPGEGPAPRVMAGEDPRPRVMAGEGLAPRVMAGEGRPSTTVGAAGSEAMDGRDKPGHDTGTDKSGYDTGRDKSGHDTGRDKPGHDTGGRGPAQDTDAPTRFTLPTIRRDAQGRPRWASSDTPGVLRHETTASPDDWLPTAAALLGTRVGTEGHPPWHAVLQHHPAGTTLILAVNHALTDWRTSLHVAHAFLAGEHPGPIAPPCEELLPPAQYGDAEADTLLDAWWSARAGARWQALGHERLTAILPRATPTRFARHVLTEAETRRLADRCEEEGVSLNGALAIALRDTMQVATVAHAVDMERFIRPAPPAGPGLAVAHVFTPLAEGPFWDAARDNRAALFEQIRAGAAGDALLALPRLLMGGTPDYQPATMTITGAPTVGTRAEADPDTTMQLVLSAARGGGGILILSYRGPCLQLIAGTPEGTHDIPLPEIVARLRDACA